MSTKDNMGNRLLIIDDAPHICEGLKDRLETMGYEVITVQDGRSGLALMVLEASRKPSTWAHFETNRRLVASVIRDRLEGPSLTGMTG
jgi:CheY-like chemotaxis protein